MSRAQALLGARLIAGGRVLFGLGLVVAPEALTSRWLGDVANAEGTKVAVRALGIRDLLLGALTWHTLADPRVGPRMVATCAVGDSVDLLATLAARKQLPPSGVAATAALAGGTVVASGAIAAALRRTA